MISSLPEELNTAPCGYLSFNEKGVLLSINQTLTDLLGGSVQDYSAIKFESLLTISSRIFFQTHFFPLVKMKGSISEIYLQFRSTSGASIPFLCNANSRYEQDTLIICCVLIPVFERGKYEQELLQAKRNAEEALEKNTELAASRKEMEKLAYTLDRQVSRLTNLNQDIAQFSKVISHNLQESLRKIAILTDKVATEATDVLAPGHMADLQKVNKEFSTLRSLIANLEKFISLNAHEETPVSLDLNQVIRKVLSKLDIDEDQIAFISEPLPVIEALPEQMELLFRHILENCSQYRSDSRKLEIKISNTIIQQNTFKSIKKKYRYKDFIKINISDNGIGCGLGSQYNFELVQKKGDHPLGFGFAFSKKIVENHFGKIKMKTSDKGTTITIELPVEQSL